MFSRQVIFYRQFRARAFNELYFFTELLGHSAEHFGCLIRAEAVYTTNLRRFFATDFLVKINLVLEQVIHTLETAAHADRPGDWRALDLEH